MGTDRQTERQAGKQTDRQTDRHAAAGSCSSVTCIKMVRAVVKDIVADGGEGIAEREL